MSDNSTNNSTLFRLLRAGDLQLAVADDRVTTVTEWTEPTPLPFASKAVMGVVCLQGRMFTVVNLVKLIRADEDNTQTSHRLILALRGDEQLALAVDNTEGPFEVLATEIAASEPQSNALIQESLGHNGNNWQILNVDELFHALVQGRERRRRRF